MAEPLSVVIDDSTETVHVDPVTGDVITDQPDGGSIVQFGAAKRQKKPEDFYANLADEMDGATLAQISNELIEAITADDRSRQQYLATRTRALDLMGLEIKEPKGGVADSSAPVEGMSTVTNPLLLEAVLKGWANTVGELLPAEGPVKIQNEGDELTGDNELAEAFERDYNWYLTTGAPEYYPDTSHMLLWGVYFGGSGFKKIYRCPMRRRPVSESVDAKDLIVSDTTKDLRACARITHQIMMRPGVMKRMKFIGAYRDVALTQPMPEPNRVTEKIAQIQGVTSRMERPEDQPYTIWECQCELDLPQYAPARFKNENIPIPYIVTIDKDSREILALRRDWDEDDEEAERKRRWVKYPYVPGPGFYGTGLLNILGNASAAMTAAWREALDAGMYANFPSGLISKGSARQLTSDIRLAPGVLTPIETNGNPIGEVVSPLPYRDITPGLMALIDKITSQAQALGGAADIPAAEGIQNVPVGTMLAQIEQATKIMAAAHKGMHQACSEELALLLEMFRENPSDFWRGLKNRFWDEQKFLQAIETYKFQPRSDPNVPSHLHRVMKAIALLQLIQQPALAPLMNPKEVLMRCLRALKEDPTGLVVDPPPQQAQQPPQDPARMLMAQAAMQRAQTDAAKAQTQAQQGQQDQVADQQKLQAERDIATVDLAKEFVIHQHDAQMANRKQGLQEHQAVQQAGVANASHGLAVSQHLHDAAHKQHERAMDVAQHNLDVHQAMNPPEPESKERWRGGRVVGQDDMREVANLAIAGLAQAAQGKLTEELKRLIELQTAPRIVTRDEQGRLTGIQVVTPQQEISQTPHPDDSISVKIDD